MKKRELHHSGIFLMELMIAILFFALGSAVCLQLFAKSHQLNVQTEELHHAVNLVSSKAEELLHADHISADSRYYGKDFSSCEAKDAFYELTVSPKTAGMIQTCDIFFRKVGDDDIIYRLSVDKCLNTNENLGGSSDE